jgi:peptide-methionine (R)-S-oxide reductase
MKPVLTRFWVFVAMSALIGGSVALHAAWQDSPATGKQQAGDGTRTADAKTDGGNNSAASDPAATDTAAKDAPGKADPRSKAKAKPEEEFVRKTDAEWRKILTKQQYMVTRMKSTEPPFSGKYATGHFRGTFLCVCCDAEIFSAASKFDSGTGWPSFDRPANARSVVRAMDYADFEPRVEVMCRRCGAHLGHVFDDGPTMTGLRFCINSASIKLRPPEGESTSSKASTSRTTSRTSSKARAKPRAKTKAGTSAAATPKQPSTDSQESTGSPPADPPARDSAAPAAKPSA